MEYPFTRWSFEKPRGYSGDASLLDIDYKHRSADEMVALSSALGGRSAADTSYVNWKLNEERYNVFLNAIEAKIQHKEATEHGQALLSLSRTDPLTGLENWRAIDEKLRDYWSDWQRFGSSFVAILIHVDFFKKFTDDDTSVVQVGEIQCGAVPRHVGVVPGELGEPSFSGDKRGDEMKSCAPTRRAWSAPGCKRAKATIALTGSPSRCGPRARRSMGCGVDR